VPARTAERLRGELHDRLADSRRYERQIDRLHRRYLFTRGLYELRQDDVSLASVVLNGPRVARMLARTVRRGEYRLEPAELRPVRADGKERVVYSLRLTDMIVHGVVADILSEAIAPALSRRLYSYRSGISWWDPISDLAAYARAHRRRHRDPRQRGLYVLQRDVDAYTDTIPVGPQSLLWPVLAEALGAGSAVPEADWRLVECVVRPDVRLADGALTCPIRGVPTGQPISCVLFNLYLARLDRVLDGVPGGFYARYSDDILFAHPDAGVARRVDALIDETLAELGLCVNDEKRRSAYLTGAGRASPDWPEARGTTTVRYLGTAVSAEGTIGLSRKKVRRLLRDLERRALRTAAALGSADLDRRGTVVCSVLNRALDPAPGPFQQPSAALLRQAVTDRRQLAQLDYLLARIVLRAVTGDANVRAFRTVPYRRIRERWGLVSLLRARNAST
jgi:hypothetical protein